MPRCEITTPTSAVSASFDANSIAVSTDVTSLPTGLPSWSCSALRAGATAGSLPVSNAPCPSICSITRAAPASLRRLLQLALDLLRLLVPDRRRQLRVLHDLLRRPRRRRATRPGTGSAPTRWASPSCASVCPSSDRETSWNSTRPTAIIGMTTMTTKKSRRRFLKLGVKRLRKRMALGPAGAPK